MNENYKKLTNTTYKILDFLPESDPLKNRSKDKVLSIMDGLISINEVSGWASFGKEKTKLRIVEDIDILLGYLWIAKTQGWVSTSNCLIVSNEYERIKIELTKKQPSPVVPVLDNVEPEIPNFVISERQSKIIDFLEKNNKAQVMGLQAILPDVTKRTIRRDLDELIRLGRVVRTGDYNGVSYQLK